MQQWCDRCCIDATGCASLVVPSGCQGLLVQRRPSVERNRRCAEHVQRPPSSAVAPSSPDTARAAALPLVTEGTEGPIGAPSPTPLTAVHRCASRLTPYTDTPRLSTMPALLPIPVTRPPLPTQVPPSSIDDHRLLKPGPGDGWRGNEKGPAPGKPETDP